jgi:hypothetical protein
MKFDGKEKFKVGDEVYKIVNRKDCEIDEDFGIGEVIEYKGISDGNAEVYLVFYPNKPNMIELICGICLIKKSDVIKYRTKEMKEMVYKGKNNKLSKELKQKLYEKIFELKEVKDKLQNKLELLGNEIQNFFRIAYKDNKNGIQPPEAWNDMEPIERLKYKYDKFGNETIWWKQGIAYQSQFGGGNKK